MNELSNLNNFNLPTTEDILSAIDQIPLPTEIKKSLWKSVARLITGLVDVPVALLESKVQQIRTEANALTLVTNSASLAVAKEFNQDAFLIERTVNHFGSKLLRQQLNREKTVQLAIEDLKTNPTVEDSKTEIDSDWLEMFSNIAETKSNEDIQLLFSKILSGEIRKPGTFSPRTIQTLSLLEQNTGNIFQSFCDSSFSIPNYGESLTCFICEPFGSPGNNGLQNLGLNYSQLAQLQDAGLIQNELTAWREIPAQILTNPIKIGNKQLEYKLTNESPKENIRISIINFTKVGLELRKVIEINQNTEYLEKFDEWIVNKFKFEK